MATITAPYTAAMRLGSGFNSFTQQLCINNAVISDTIGGDAVATAPPKNNMPQSVVYKTVIIDRATDVSSAMNINAAFLVKYDSLNVEGAGKFANSSKIKESDVSFMVSVKVVNQIIDDYSLTQFQPIAGLTGLSAAQLTDIYGDCFISGFQEGGEFTAVISIRVNDRRQRDEIVAKAKVDFTNAKAKIEAGNDVADKAISSDSENSKKQLSANVEGFFGKDTEEILSQNETTITVAWSGGGQQVKRPGEDWTYETMRDAALRFPDLVAATPMRTHAILTKYTALRSFYGSQIISLPTYDKIGPYTNLLQEAYLDYKTIQKNLQVTAFEVSEGLKALVPNPRYSKLPDASKPSAPSGPEPETAPFPQPNGEFNPGLNPPDGPPNQLDVPPLAQNPFPPNPFPSSQDPIVRYKPLVIEQPYEPTLEGLEQARLHVRYQMNRIIQEIDNLARDPTLATREDYVPPYMSPFLFKRWLPIAIDVPTQESVAKQQVVAAKAEETGLAE